jgi:hypothetical protein
MSQCWICVYSAHRACCWHYADCSNLTHFLVCFELTRRVRRSFVFRPLSFLFDLGAERCRASLLLLPCRDRDAPSDANVCRPRMLSDMPTILECLFPWRRDDELVGAATLRSALAADPHHPFYCRTPRLRSTTAQHDDCAWI